MKVCTKSHVLFGQNLFSHSIRTPVLWSVLSFSHLRCILCIGCKAGGTRQQAEVGCALHLLGQCLNSPSRCGGTMNAEMALRGRLGFFPQDGSVLFFLFMAPTAAHGSFRPRGSHPSCSWGLRHAAMATLDLSCICDLYMAHGNTGSLTH